MKIKFFRLFVLGIVLTFAFICLPDSALLQNRVSKKSPPLQTANLETFRANNSLLNRGSTIFSVAKNKKLFDFLGLKAFQDNNLQFIKTDEKSQSPIEAEENEEKFQHQSNTAQDGKPHKKGLVHGKEAIDKLGDRLSEVASKHDKTTDELRRLFLEDSTLYVNENGNLLYIDDFKVDANVADDTPQEPQAAPFPYSQTFLLHSRPGSNRIIYLDFDGHTTTGTQWNSDYGIDPINSAPFSIDADPNTFNQPEQDVIQYVWQRVAEDYAPFDVDVTTQYPGDAAIIRTFLGNDNQYGARAVITPTNFTGAGGIAYVGAFNSFGTALKPAFVFTNVSNDEKYIAEAVSHEVGHNLGLHHDGNTQGTTPNEREYYAGHGDWAPIMGVGYYKNITQWNPGEYPGANNFERDWAVMQSYGITVRPDDHGDTIGNATVMNSGSSVSGVITSSTDADVFRFTVASDSDIPITINPAARGANLDIRAELLDSAGNVIVTSDPSSLTTAYPAGLSASFDEFLRAGVYYLRIIGTAAGDLATGYSVYGSIGQYTINIGTPRICTSIIYLEQTASGTLDSSCISLNGYNSKYYAFNGTAGQQINIQMNAGFDAYLELYKGNELIAFDNNGGGGFNSRIPAGSGNFTLPATATYKIVARSTYWAATGNFTLSLSSPSCIYTLMPASQNFPGSGGSKSFQVNTASNCAWTAINNAPSWITVQNNSGAGNTTINYMVAANTGAARIGTVSVAGQIFTVSQAESGTYWISGNVKSDGLNLSSATINLIGAQVPVVLTGADGNYSFIVTAGGNYTVSVYKSGFTFNPASQTFMNLQTDQTANFLNGTLLCIPPASNLASRYKGENNANDSQGINNATISGATFTAGKVGQAFFFDGVDDFVQSGGTTIMNGLPLTIEAWVNPWIRDDGTDFPTNTVSNDIPGQSGHGFGLNVYRGTFVNVGQLKVEYHNGFRIVPVAPGTFAPGFWYHIAVVYTYGNVKTYVNGNLADDFNFAQGGVDGINLIRIGKHNDDTNYGTRRFFRGLIDEAGVYNRALSTSEIQLIYNAGSAGVCTNSILTLTNKIAFTSFRTGNHEIFTMNPDGSNQTNITNNVAQDADPAFSPDGSKIVFWSDRGNNIDVYSMNADGSNQTKLTTHASNDYSPSWSPDSTKIVFYSSRDGNPEIYLMNSNGSNQTRLTTNTANDYNPKFSPDGTRIVFSSERDGNQEIYVMNADGTNQTRLTNNSATDAYPIFSPDGTKIAFMSSRTGNYDVYVMNADGSNPVNLTNSPGHDGVPAWSPDGAEIAFETERDNDREIYVMNANGTNPIRLTNNALLDASPSWWSPIAINVVNTPTNKVILGFSNVSNSGYTIGTPLAQAQLPYLPVGYGLLTPLLAYDFRTSAVYSGNITVMFNVPNIPHSQMCDRLRSLHFENGDWTTAGNAAPIYNVATQICTLRQIVSSLSPFVVAQMLAPTAASVSVGGRILTADGRGIRNVRVTLANSAGETRTVLTGPFGYYRFADVQVGETYVISIAAKRFVFNPPSRILTLQEELNNVDFTALIK